MRVLRVTTEKIVSFHNVHILVRYSLRHNHLNKREAIKYGSKGPLIHVSNVIQNNTFAIVEPDVKLPILPFELTAIELEGRALGLRDFDGLEIPTEATLSLDSSGVVVDWFFSAKRPPLLGNVNVDNLALIGVEDWAEVQRILVLAIVQIRAEVHQRLLETDVTTEAFVVSYGPRIAINFVHLVLTNAANLTLLNDLGVYSNDMLDKLQLFHRNL